MSAAGPQHVTAVFAQYGDMGGRMFMSSAARARAAPRYILARFALQCKNCGKKAGLEAIDTRVIRISVAFADFEDFWNSNTVPVGPQGKLIQGMSPSARMQLRTRLREHLPIASDGRIVYESFANAVKGRVLG
jgi:hypothetical protein